MGENSLMSGTSCKPLEPLLMTATLTLLAKEMFLNARRHVLNKVFRSRTISVRKEQLSRPPLPIKLRERLWKMDQCRPDLMFMRTSSITRVEYITMYMEQWKEATQWRSSAGEWRTVWSIGLARTPGTQHGAKMASLELSRETVELMIQCGLVNLSIMPMLCFYNDFKIKTFNNSFFNNITNDFEFSTVLLLSDFLTTRINPEFSDFFFYYHQSNNLKWFT